MRHLTCAIALGVKSGGGGRGRRGRVPSSSKVWKGRPPETSELLRLKKCFEWHIIQLYSRNAGRKLHSGRWFRAYHNALLHSKVCRWLWAYHTTPHPPPPSPKSLWRGPWLLPSLFRTYLAVQNCIWSDALSLIVPLRGSYA